MKGIYSDRVLTPEGLRARYIAFDEKIRSVSEKPLSDVAYTDFSSKIVSPGFIDLHTHGGGGHPFINGTAEDVAEGCLFHLRHGTTTILPTVSAAPLFVMREAIKNIAEAMHSTEFLPHIPGAHLEGPYLSSKQCGAQCPSFITPPNPQEYEPLIEEYGQYIARVTYAPENDPDGTFCRFLCKHGILVSAGHSDAKYPAMKTAVDNGCRLITHLYSCTSTVTRDHGFRSPGIIEAAFLHDELSVEIIADGRHLPPELIRMIVRIKGKDRVALITDSLHITGTDVTEGEMSGTPFIVEDGVCKLRDRSAFAGSIATADQLLRVLTLDCGIPLSDAVAMLTVTPARLLGLPKGEIAVGKDADFVVFDEKITVNDIFVAGRKER
jgi:N-acetylglucosamine-6-phosphate deacetylase